MGTQKNSFQETHHSKMKLFKFAFFSPLFALECYSCDEHSYTLCDENKILQTCEPDQTACFIEESQIHGNMVTHVKSGCQQELACINNFIQNFPSDLLLSQLPQCFSEARTKISTCRQCCTTDSCNLSWVA